MKEILDPKDVEKFCSFVEESRKIVITCHMRPDGDALGSSLGFWHILKGMGKEVTVVIPDRAPRSLAFLPGMRDIVVCSMYDPYSERLVRDADLIIMCDFNSLKRLGDLGKYIGESKARKILIDHHLYPDVERDLTFSHPEMSSTCELAFRLIAAAGYYPYVGIDAATALLTGLITDTQNFSVNCNNYEIYEILENLLKKGVDKKRIINEALKSTTLDALRLRSFAFLERLRIWEKHRCSVIFLTRDDLDRFHYQKGDTEGVVNEPLGLPKVIYSIFLREDPDCIKVSTRSKMDFPVNMICSDLFGGGGHLMAAGGEFKGSMEECMQLLKERLGDYDRFLPKEITIER